MTTVDATHDLVREFYAERALTGSSCCGSGCGCGAETADQLAAAVGYSEDDIALGAGGANLGLGCGNPTALDAIRAGATVLDLGSGAGFDCFLAARQVGPEGHVIGVDMTAEMIDRARANAAQMDFPNVEFRLGLIEDLPLENESIDVIISNCVINLSPQKPRVFAEAYRVLKPGGKLMVSDIVLSRELPEAVRNDALSYAACVSGAELQEEYVGMIEAAGFRDIQILGEDDYLADSGLGDVVDAAADGAVRSLKVVATK